MKMNGKVVKKDQIYLKFDTSSDNLACFMNKKSKQLHDNDNNNDRQSKSTRKRTKSVKSKPCVFKNQDFLQSILANALTQQFVGQQDIKKLVKNLQICCEEDPINDVKLYPQPEIYQKNLKKLQSGDLNQQYKLWIDSNAEKTVERTRVGTDDTPEISNKQANNISQSSFSQQLILPYQSPYAYPQFQSQFDHQNYYTYQQYSSSHSPDRKKKANNEQSRQYRIQLDKIEADGRTTLMIKNIPNKYTQELLLEQFNKNYKVKFDFFYLPIDYNNACNVGYAFINFIHAKFISSFYNEFNGKRWSKFNSEKICCLTYARIQGTGALRLHFKNSHVMQQKDKKFRPLLNQLDEEQRYSLSKIVQGQQQKI